MLYFFLLSLPILLVLGGLVLSFLTKDKNFVAFGVSCLFALFGAIICWTIAGEAYTAQANDLGTYFAQDNVIAVYQEQVDVLTKELTDFHYQPGTVLNADSPVASVVKALTDAQAEVTQAKATKAQAIVNIEKRRRGPLSGVISLAGDYK